ncbi:MAG TPA: peptide-methionine (S)-S-oxide reductase, partial [Bacteroides sp.]|nr:peptide-methionine (S)-S-oxide reductase [Bacteroides sp.]
MKTEKSESIATFGSGCFWCTEAVFERLEGVDKVISGFSGGTIKNPSYKEITRGNTGHAEVCQIYYNPEIISFKELLDVFWNTHDPTTL